MTAIVQDMDIIEQGATWVKNFFFMQEDGVTPVDTVGAQYRMQIREKIESPAFVIELTTANGKIQHDPATGSVTLTITDEETAAMAFKTAVFDIEVAYTDGTVDRLWQGNIALSRNVTR